LGLLITVHNFLLPEGEINMSAQPFVASPENYPQSLSIVGEHITILASKAMTDGYEIFLQEGPEGTGPPPHSHPWDESFYVVQGMIEFGYNDQHLTAQSGTLVHIPSGTVHWFRFKEGGGKMLSITGQGSDASPFFTDLDAEIPSGATDLEKIQNIANRHKVTFSID
jgi:quercetin dioxygenase-like cupin family protein